MTKSLFQYQGGSWKRTLMILAVCQFIAMTGMSALVPFLPLFIRELGISDTNQTAIWSGLVFAGPFVTSFLVQPLWGVLGDRSGRKLMAVRALFGLALAQILIFFVPNVYWLLGIRLLQGTLSGFNVAAMSLITSISPKEKQGYSISMLQSANNGGVVIGPIIGGLLSAISGFRGVFLIVGITIAVLAFVVIFFVEESKNEKTEGEETRVRDNFKDLINNRVLFGTAGLILLTSLGISSLRPIFVLYVESFDLSETFSLALQAGALYSILGIFSTVSSVYFSKVVDKVSLKKILGLASLGTGVMYCIHPFIQSIYWLIPIRTVLGLSYGIIIPVLFTQISKNSGERNKGGMLALATSSQTLGVIIGSVVSGKLVTLIGVRYPFLAVGLFFISLALITPMFKRD
jgi:DHA1 family multidrug resistance protein-like MFS transporter